MFDVMECSIPGKAEQSAKFRHEPARKEHYQGRVLDEPLKIANIRTWPPCKAVTDVDAVLGIVTSRP